MTRKWWKPKTDKNKPHAWSWKHGHHEMKSKAFIFYENMRSKIKDRKTREDLGIPSSVEETLRGQFHELIDVQYSDNFMTDKEEDRALFFLKYFKKWRKQ